MSLSAWVPRSSSLPDVVPILTIPSQPHPTSSSISGGQLGSYALGNVLICAVSGTYVASSLLFALAAIEEEKKITVEWEKINKSV